MKYHIHNKIAPAARVAILLSVLFPILPHAQATTRNLNNQGGEATPCGNGERGNGICADGLCCSQYGYCGSTPDHCETIPPTEAPAGTCGDGRQGDGKCPDGTCCSEHRWCGTTAEHCCGFIANGICPVGTCCSEPGSCETTTENRSSKSPPFAPTLAPTFAPSTASASPQIESSKTSPSAGIIVCAVIGILVILCLSAAVIRSKYFGQNKSETTSSGSSSDSIPPAASIEADHLPATIPVATPTSPVSMANPSFKDQARDYTPGSDKVVWANIVPY